MFTGNNISYIDIEKYKVKVPIQDIPYSRSYEIHKTDYKWPSSASDLISAL